MTYIGQNARPAPSAWLGPDRGELALAVGGMLAVASSMGIGRFVYTPILPAMAAGLGLTKGEAGLIASANFVGYLVGALLTASPRLSSGRRGWFLGALILGAVSTGAMAIANSMAAFLVLRFVGGASSAFVLVLGSALVLERLAMARRSGLAAVHFSGVGVGIAVSAALVDALQASGADWRDLWLGAGAAACAVIPVVAYLVPGGSATAATPPPATVSHSSPIRARGLGALSLCHGLFGFGYVVTATFLVAAVRAAPGAQSLETVVWLIVGLAAVPSTSLWARIGSRHGALRGYALACIVEAVGVAAGGVWPTVAGALLASVLLGGTFMGLTSLGFAAARAIAPDQQRRAFAVITAAFGVGQIAGPVVAGFLLDRTGSFAAPSLIAAAALVIAAAVAMRTAPERGWACR